MSKLKLETRRTTNHVAERGTLWKNTRTGSIYMVVILPQATILDAQTGLVNIETGKHWCWGLGKDAQTIVNDKVFEFLSEGIEVVR